jgi:hypothetical protein
LSRFDVALNLDDHAGHGAIGVVVQDDHGIGAILGGRDLGEIERAELDARVVDCDPGAGPQELDGELAIAAEQLDEDLVVERQHGSREVTADEGAGLVGGDHGAAGSTARANARS